MKRFLSLLAVLLLAAVVQGLGKTVSYSGPCQGSVLGSKWLVVVTVDDVTGRVIRREGTNCLGQHWVDSCPPVQVPQSPRIVPSGQHLIESDPGTPGSWWVAFDTDADGRIIDMWGKDAEGVYWEIGAGSPLE